MERALDTAVTYAGERKQFGRPIGKFQAVQQNLAVMAGQVAAAGAAADAGVEALSIDDPAKQEFLIAIAKTRVGDAATLASEIAHQVHGAIGFTKEYSLQLSTRRLWSWRDEFGGEAEWAAKVGAYVCARGADALWPTLTIPDRPNFGFRAESRRCPLACECLRRNLPNGCGRCGKRRRRHCRYQRELERGSAWRIHADCSLI